MSDHLRKLFESCPTLPWSFTPLNGKIPINKGWQKAPHETRQQALQWAAHGNIGLRCGEASGGLLVVDLDVDKGEYDVATVRGLRLPATITAKTGSGGYHLYFQLPDDVTLGNTSGRLAAAVDTRGEGGQVVFPGSRHPDNGNLYTWMPGHAPWDIALAELPPHIISLLASDAPGPGAAKPDKAGAGMTGKYDHYIKAALAGEMASVSNAAPGTRNHTLNVAAFSLGQLVGGGVLDRGRAENCLWAACVAGGCPEKHKAGCLATIASGLDSGVSEPRTPPAPPPPARQAAKKSTAVSPPVSGEDKGAIGADGFVKNGQRDPETRALVLSAKRTLPTARAYIRENATHDGKRTVHSYAGRIWRWLGNRYVEAEDGAIRHKLLPWLHAAKRRVRDSGKFKLVPFDCNPSTVNAALETIRAAVHLDASLEVPFWLGDDPNRPPPAEVLACLNENLHIPSGEVTPPTPELFTFNALDFDYNPDAPPPEAWLEFLGQLWASDRPAIGLLQEWLGYCLTADTSQQKMLLLVGPKRSGKGTVGRVLTELIGRGNVCGPTIGSLGKQFGMSPLLGKSLALVSDARFSGPDMQAVVERLLCISGEDTITIDRKHVDAVTVKLPTRFMFLSNELPRLQDAAGALAGRFLILTLTESFFGCEDPHLTGRLFGELPGILLWALRGWKRLHDRGKFVVPESSQDSEDMLMDLLSPVSAFLRERCADVAGEKVLVADLFVAWCEWCEAAGGGKYAGTRQEFGRRLKAARPALKLSRNHKFGRSYIGICLKVLGGAE